MWLRAMSPLVGGNGGAEDAGATPFAGHVWTALECCGEGPGTRRGGPLGEALLGPPFLLGETVAVDLKSNSRHCHGIVLEAGGAADATLASMPGVAAWLRSDELCAAMARQRRRFAGDGADEGDGDSSTVRLRLEGGGVCAMRASRLTRVLPASAPRLLIVADTTSYRRLARTQIGGRDAVLEMGSSLGECTKVLQCHAAVAVGVEVQGDLVEQSRARHPQCRFEWLDCYEEPARLRELCRELQAKGLLKVFVDIGGTRSAADVCRMLGALEEAAGPTPLVVVKCKALAKAAAESCSEALAIADVEDFLRQACAPPPPGSAKQLKKKLARARKAKWEGATEADWAKFRSLRGRWGDAEEHGRMAAEIRRLKEESPEAWGDTFRLMLARDA